MAEIPSDALRFYLSYAEVDYAEEEGYSEAEVISAFLGDLAQRYKGLAVSYLKESDQIVFFVYKRPKRL